MPEYAPVKKKKMSKREKCGEKAVLESYSQTCLNSECERLLGPDALRLFTTEIITKTRVYENAKTFGYNEFRTKTYVCGKLDSWNFL